ncbi:MAG: excinuclease ABC subunit UvrA [Lachnospiraceae bacterium]|nr:excinuclease ABC subunit UvrA [Lachnospiraceae bacterium]
MKKNVSTGLIKIRGAGVHNLKNIDLDIPRDKFIVITGVSGSGKSSLAFDTIFAEGQRRYMESLSSYARQFLGQMEKPKVTSIEGMSPAISIDQKSTNRNPRSTVGTVTEIYDYLRLLYARIGIPHCPNCGKEIKKQSIDEIVDTIMKLEVGTKIQLLAYVVRGKKGRHERVIESAKKAGYSRVRIDGNDYSLDEEITLDKNIKHNIEIIVDRLVIKEGVEKRLSDSIETVFKLSDGLLQVDVIGGKPINFSENFSCPDCGISIQEIEPRSFSFNNPFGACEECSGLGYKQEFDIDLMIPDKTLSINEGCIVVTGFASSHKENSWSGAILREVAKKYKVSLDTPWKNLSKREKDIILYGIGDDTVNVRYKSAAGNTNTWEVNWSGLIETCKERYRDWSTDAIKAHYEQFMTLLPCEKCHGQRLKESSLAVTVGDKNIAEICDLSLLEFRDFISNLKLTPMQKKIGELILKEIKVRVNFLIDVGLEYLSLSRMTATLSGGEAQRIRLATQIGTGLVGVCYILDEPSIGLHQKDNTKLIATLKNLRDLGNTVIVVEHDEETMREADYIVDIGPYAGVNGGRLVAAGSIKDIEKCKDSITGKYLSKKLQIEKRTEYRKPKGFLTIKGAREHNLKNIDVNIPISVFTCITGVSGSGKSSLINEILYKSLAKKLNDANVKTGQHDEIIGVENFDKIVMIDQSPIGKTPRSNPATYTGVYDLIRDLYASTPDAKMRGYAKGRFSFNVKGGRCEKCEGDGIIKIEMHFLPDVYVTCDACGGKRYNRETLEVKYKGKSIFDVLDMTIDEANVFFKNQPRIMKYMEVLKAVGLGYMKLGQPATELSGGEAQRVKLATELSKRATGKTIYILDEPTTGLHFYDVHKLIDILQKLTDTGNTVVVIEHNLDVIKSADYIIDLGPDSGDKGGTIVATGTPLEVSKVKKSYTGMYLKKIL